MSQLFPRAADPLLKIALVAGCLLAALAPTFLLAYERSPYITQEADPVEQPIRFDHRHHVRDNGMDCLFCHQGATKDDHAGVPTSELCMQCHAQVWNHSDSLSPVRKSAFEERPVVWQRVTNLPMHVFFNHGAHAAKGVGCVECHGRVDLMAAVYATQPMNMQFCIDCHKDPEPHLRSPEHLTDMTYVPSAEERARVHRDLHVSPKINCTTCHR